MSMRIEPLPRASTAMQSLEVDQAAATQKQQRLFDSMRSLDSLLVALSGGADSAYLAWAAHTVLGARALAVTALSASFSRHDREQADKFVRASGIRHELIETSEFDNPLYTANNVDRCYHCKDELFDRMEALAGARNFRAIAYGINADDTHDFRPGHRAAREHRVLAPLLDAALGKTEIRWLSQRAGLSTWDRAESVLRALGFRQFRVRAHGELARIEFAPDELFRGLEPALSQQIVDGVKQAGFGIVTIDLEGYRQGSLNSLLKIK